MTERADPAAPSGNASPPGAADASSDALARENRLCAEVERLNAELASCEERLKTPKRLTRRAYLDLTRAINQSDGDDKKLAELFDPDDGA